MVSSLPSREESEQDAVNIDPSEVTATPFKKSRREIDRSIPSRRSDSVLLEVFLLSKPFPEFFLKPPTHGHLDV